MKIKNIIIFLRETTNTQRQIQNVNIVNARYVDILYQGAKWLIFKNPLIMYCHI